MRMRKALAAVVLVVASAVVGCSGSPSARARAENGKTPRAGQGTDLSEEAFKLEPGQMWKTLVVSSVRTVRSDLTIPPSVALRFENGGMCDVMDGTTLTIDGPVQAPLVQIFRGAGKVALGSGAVERIYPQWWGARPDDGVDDTAAIQAAIDSLSSKVAYEVMPPNGGVVYFTGGRFDVSSTIKFYDGMTLEGTPARTELYSADGVDVMLQSHDPNVRSFPSRIAWLTLNGGTSDKSGVGLDLTNACYATIDDVNILNFKKGVVMDELCIYNTFLDIGLGPLGEVGIEAAGASIQDNFFGGRIGAVPIGFLAKHAQAIYIYGMSFEHMTTGVDLRDGDTVNLHHPYFENVATCVKIAPSFRRCTILSPKYVEKTISRKIDDQSEDALILDATMPRRGEAVPSEADRAGDDAQ